MRVLMVIPAYNEAAIISRNVETVLAFMQSQTGYDWHLMVAEHESTDGTVPALEALAQRHPRQVFSFAALPARSKSDAIRQAWLAQAADVYLYMDADLSTDIRHIPELVAGIREGFEIVTGSRGLKGSLVARSMQRNLISKGYNRITKLLFALPVHDLQCGFKAVSRRALDDIVRQTRYLKEGFMDTEMLILAARKGYAIKEIPVVWKDDRKSKFNFFMVAVRFIANLLRVKRDLALGRYRL